MLDITKKGTCQTSDSMVWDYYGDDGNDTMFYVVPTPTLARDETGRPIFSLVEYSTSDANAGGGYCYLSTVLWIPPADLPQIETCIKNSHPGITPQLNTLEFKSGGQVMLQYVGDDELPDEVYARATPTTEQTSRPSSCQLSPSGMALFKAIFGGQQSSAALSVIYPGVQVPARMPKPVTGDGEVRLGDLLTNIKKTHTEGSGDNPAREILIQRRWRSCCRPCVHCRHPHRRRVAHSSIPPVL